MKRGLGLSISKPYENVFASGLFECIEYSIGADFNREDAFELWEGKTAEIKELCSKYGVKLRSYHLPFNGERFNGVFMHAPAALDPSVRERTLEHTKRQILSLLDTGLELLIIHGSLRIEESNRQRHLDNFVDYLCTLCDYCKPLGITVAVETLLECCIGGGGDLAENRIAEFRYIIEKANRDNLGICLDNNHFIKSSCIDFVEALGQYVVTTHFSDYDGVEEKHRMPGDGITDWRRLVGLLTEKGYAGPFVFEVSFAEYGGPTDEALKKLTDGWRELIK